MAAGGGRSLRFKGQLKTIELGSVQYTELPHSLCVGYVDPEKEDGGYGDVPPPRFQQAPTGVSVIGRVMNLVQKTDPGTGNLSTKAKAAHIAASELRVFWVNAMTAAPVTEINAAKKILKVYEEFNSLNKYPQGKRGETWSSKVSDFNNRMLTGLNVATTDKKVISKVKEEFEIQIKDDDKKLVEDNCKVKTCSCSHKAVAKCKQCPRQMYISLEVDSKWFSWRERKRQDQDAEEKSKEASDLEKETVGKKVDIDSVDLSDDENGNIAEQLPMEALEQESTSTRTLPSRSCVSGGNRTSRAACTCTCQACTCSCHSSEPRIPSIPIRFSRNELNPKVMRAVTHVQATYKISDNDTRGLIVDIANLIFDQKWEKEIVLDDTEEVLEDESSDEDAWLPADQDKNRNNRKSTAAADTSVIEREEARKIRNVQRDLTNRFPSRATLRRWMESASLLNLLHVAKILLDEDCIKTIGFDDTTKAAGRRLFDSKALNITVDGDGKHRRAYTTGFHPNLSHSGEDQTETLKFALEQMAVLAGVGLDEFIEQVDFWMTDRSGDGDIVMENLGVDSQKILKCSAHIILCIDKSIDSVYLQVESSIGRDKLIGVNIGNMAFTSSESIVTLGLMALSKLVSSSHAAVSYSMYESYKLWREREGLDNSNFYGFSENRFGRTAALASMFLKHKPDLQRFFAEVVDENSNKLVLAVSTYIESDWFYTGCLVYDFFGTLLIQPLCSLLGVDEKKKDTKEEKSWTAVKEFFDEKKQALAVMLEKGKSGSSIDQLESKCATKILEGLERQLSKVGIFRGEFTEETIEKLKHAPLTNSGCESRQAQLDVRVKHSGGSAPLQNISNKQTVAVNGYLKTSDFDDLEKAGELFKWARTADEAKKVRQMQKEFNAKVESVKFAALKKKENLKKKRFERSLKLYSKCSEHGGPLTADNLEKMEDLQYKELVAEVSYIKSTIGKDIKMKKRITDPDTKKFKMIPLPSETLKNSIRNVLKPENESAQYSVQNLLTNYFSKEV